MRPSWLVLAIGLLAGVAARGAEPEDVDFARGLIRRGYLDLAEEMCGRVEKNSALTPAGKASLQFVRAEIQLESAATEPDAEKSRKQMDGAVALLEAFVKANPAHPLLHEARLSLGWSFMRRARAAAWALRAEPDPKRQGELRKQASGMFVSAEKFSRGSVKDLKAAAPTPEVDGALMDAFLELARTLIEHARLPGLPVEERNPLLEEAIKILADFAFDYGDRIAAYEAMRLEGECRSELGDFKNAETKIRDALSLRVRLAELKIRPDEYQLAVLRDATLSMVQLHLKAGRPAKAVEAADLAVREDPGLTGTDPGYALLMEKAEALSVMGNAAAANALANEVMKTGNPRWSAVARDKIAAWVSGPSRGPATAERMMTAAESFLDKEQWRDALQALRRCLELAVSTAEREKYGAPAAYKMGQCFVELKRQGEAIYAFEAMYTAYPRHELAPRACFEAVRCAAYLFGATGDPRDEAWKEQILKVLIDKWPDHPAARNVAFIQAEKLENAKQYRQAADTYAKVREDAEAYESALVRAGYCYYKDAEVRWYKEGKTDAGKAAARDGMKLAEAALRKFLARLGKADLVPKEPDLLKMRENLASLAYQQLAIVTMHEAVGRTADSLQLLDECAKPLRPDDERLAKLWGLKIQGLLSLGRTDEAIELLEKMYQQFPDGLAIAKAAKAVAVRLHEATADLMAKKGDEKGIRENLRRIGRYYATWLNEGPPNGLSVKMVDIMSVSEMLYLVAKRLNNLDDGQISFLDLHDKVITEPQFFKDASFVHAQLLGAGQLPDGERLKAMTRLARCQSFVATDVKEWDKAKAAYMDVISAFKLVDAKENIDRTVLQKLPALLPVYMELGCVYLELGKRGQKFQYDNALSVFGNILPVVPPGSQVWWTVKYAVLSALYERGTAGDFEKAKVAIEMLERNNPDFDGGTYGMKERFAAFKKKIDAVKGK